MKLKREFSDATDDVTSVSRDFKHDVMKVKPDIFEPRVVERPTFKRELPKKDAQRPRHTPKAVPMQDVYAESPSQAGRDPSDQLPEMMFQPMEEGFVSPGAMPAADLGDAPEHSTADVAALDTEAAGPMDKMPTAPRMEAESEIVVMSPGAESMGTTSAPMGYESPYVKALMANTSSEAASMPSSRYVFDFDGWDDEEEIEVVEEAPAESATEAPAPNFVIFDLSEPVEEAQEPAEESAAPNFVLFDLSEPAPMEASAEAPVFVLFDTSEPAEESQEPVAEMQEPNFVAFDLSEPVEEPVESMAEAQAPVLVAFDLSEPAEEAVAESQAPNFVLFDLTEPAEETAEPVAEMQEPNFVLFDLTEPAEETAEPVAEMQEPNFVLFDLTEPAEETAEPVAEAQAPVFVAFDVSEPAEETAEEIAAESQEPNFVAFDLSEPVPVEASPEAEPPVLVAFDLSEPAEEVVAESAAVEMEDEVKGLMEITVPEIESDAIEAEDSFSGETAADDDDANLAPMIGSDAVEAPAPVLAEPETVLQAPAGETIEAPVEVAAEAVTDIPSEAAEASTGISFGFLSGIQASGETGMEFVFGIHHDDEYVADSCESQTSDNAVQAAPANSQRFYL